MGQRRQLDDGPGACAAMSTAQVANDHSSSETVRIPGWLWAGGVIVVLTALIVGIGGWLLVSVVTQSNTLVNHEARINTIEKGIERLEVTSDGMDTKLDRILGKLDK